MMVLPPADTQAMVVAIYPRLHKGQATNEYFMNVRFWLLATRRFC
jgi:hypothetical protein